MFCGCRYWSYELFGCLSDWRLCCATFLCPCYTLGRNAAYFGDDGALAGVLYGLGLIGVRVIIIIIIMNLILSRAPSDVQWRI